MAKVNDIGFTTILPVSSKGSQDTVQDGASGFSEIMKQATEAGKQSQDDLMNLTKGTDQKAGAKDSVKAAKDADASLAAKKDKVQQADTAKSNVKKAEGQSPAKDVKEISAAETEALEETAESLGISVDELAALLESMGLTVADLMQPGNMAELLAAVQDIGPADIVLSEELTARVLQISGEVTESLQEAANALGMSVDELTAAIREQAELQTQQAAPAVEEVSDIKVTGKEAVIEEDASDDESAADENMAAKSPAAEQIAKESTEGARESDSFGRQKGDGKKQSVEPQPQQAAAPGQQVSSEQPITTQGVADRMEQSLSAQRTQQVIEQIAEHVKTTGGDKLNGIEMMLNPANLGSIKLQLESDNGVIRGQLTASDEAVRAALESQLSQLRDALIEQGMKVDAIEVTVAGHELEQNLDQSGQEAEQQARDMAAKRNPRRILDLGDPGSEELIEEMSDAEKLEVEMMRMGGNRLNFQA